jgi:hypothetical protein
MLSRLGIVDGITHAKLDGGTDTAEFLLSSLNRAGIEGAIILNRIGPVQDAFFLQRKMTLDGRIFPVARIDPFRADAVELQRKVIATGSAGIYLSAMGSFQSPMRQIDLNTIESVPLWNAASKARQVVVVEPSVRDAHLLPMLACSFPRVRILVRGGLISRPDVPGVPRALPTPDRFTFDRLHQLENVWVQISEGRTRPVATFPSSTAGGWHDPENLLALFSGERILWGSEHTFSSSEEYRGPIDPMHEISNLRESDRYGLLSTAARRLLSW